MGRVSVGRVSVGRVQVIDLLNGLNRLVLLSRVLFSSSLFGGGLFSRLFTLFNDVCESVRRRTLRQLFGRLHGDGNHRLLRMHRNMTGRYLRHNRLLRLRDILLRSLLRGSRVCRLFRLALSCFTLCSLTSGDFLSFTLCSFTLSGLTCRSFLSLTLHTLCTRLRTLLTTLRKTLTALRKTITSRGNKAHQTLTQVRALIRKTRQLTAAIRHQGATQQHTESHAGTHRQRGMRRESQRLSANLRKTTNTQRAVRNPAQPQGTKRGQNTGHHAQRHSRNQRRQRAEGNLQGNPLIQVVLTLTQEPPASNRTGSYRHQQAHQTERAHRLGHGTQNRKHRQGTSIATGQTNRSARTKGETGTGRPGNRINHQVRQETQLQQSHRSITHSARMQLLVGGNNLRPASQNTDAQKHRTQTNQRHKSNHRSTYHSPGVRTRPTRILAHLRNLLRSINTHHARERTRLTVATPHQTSHHNTQRHQGSIQRLKRLWMRARPTVHRRTNQRIGHRTGQHRNQKLTLIRGARQATTRTVTEQQRQNTQTQRHQRHRAGRSTKSSRKIQRNTVNQKPQVRRHGGHGGKLHVAKTLGRPHGRHRRKHSKRREQGSNN